MQHHSPFYGFKIPSIKDAVGLSTGLISTKPEQIDYFFGKPRSGTAASVLFSMSYQKPLLVKDTTLQGEYLYEFDINAFKKVVDQKFAEQTKSATIVVAVEPFGITAGIIIADIANKPFIFVDSKSVNHLPKNTEPDTRVLLLCHPEKSAEGISTAQKLLCFETLDVVSIYPELLPEVMTERGHNYFENKKILTANIEHLYSMTMH